jgi:SAM-dependent methyltransferase
MTDDRSGEDRSKWWTETYREGEAPWDTGRPQSRIVALADDGRIEGRVLDVGCGTGTEALALARRGHAVVGVDFAPTAIERARERAADRSFKGDATFAVADAFALSAAGIGSVETVVDVGLFHTLERRDYADYAESLASVLGAGGRVVLLEFGPDAPADWGPDPVSEADVRRAFGDGWAIETIESAPFETRQGAVPGILAVIERTG